MGGITDDLLEQIVVELSRANELKELELKIAQNSAQRGEIERVLRISKT